MDRPSALVFDVYGTLFDVHGITGLADERWPGRGAELSDVWRRTQLGSSWLRSLMGRYADFGSITADALDHACALLGLALDARTRERLLEAYRHLPPFPDVRDTLDRLHGIRLAILSNGSAGMITGLVEEAQLASRFEAILSVEEVRIFKPAPGVYRLAAERLGLPASEIGFVSANDWDAVGAQAFGFRAFWINRTGRPLDRLGIRPELELRSLAELATVLGTVDGPQLPA